nr:immunoglobulin heavy chain junction region [Macaca mulatta]MOW88357.1 immunoglobulin heavy chain junction region [Macaca mulatta]MOW88502.1 immunoglobulin heavy chain junction region [Macaca mulatta]MOW88620.1 immunoglobulin heavy chain junction region [Macaca mulatta]MOW88991.1 immunoglobulin heavy chain junction region [Macaca mulatta]
CVRDDRGLGFDYW